MKALFNQIYFMQKAQSKMRLLALMFLVSFLFCLLSACSTSLNHTTNDLTTEDLSVQKHELWQQRQDRLVALKTINLNGSVSYYSPNQKEYVRFTLTFKDKQHYLFKLTSPISTTILSLAVSPTEAILKDQNGTEYRGDNPVQLVQKLIQLTLPLDSLFDWILGIDSVYQVQNVNDQGAIFQGAIFQNEMQSQSNHWHWQVLDWQSNSSLNLKLPKQMEVTAKDTRIQINISRWNFKL